MMDRSKNLVEVHKSLCHSHSHLLAHREPRGLLLELRFPDERFNLAT